MSNEVRIVEVKELSDELVSYRLRYGNDELSDTWHTMSVRIGDHDASLAARKADIAAVQAAKHAWRQKNKP